MISQKRIIHSSRFLPVSISLLKTTISSVISLAMNMKNPLAPQIRFNSKNSVVDTIIAPIVWVIHATKYPDGVFQLNGSLQPYMKCWNCFHYSQIKFNSSTFIFDNKTYLPTWPGWKSKMSALPNPRRNS